MESQGCYCTAKRSNLTVTLYCINRKLKSLPCAVCSLVGARVSGWFGLRERLFDPTAIEISSPVLEEERVVPSNIKYHHPDSFLSVSFGLERTWRHRITIELLTMDSTPEALSLNDVSPENKRSGKLQKRDSLFDDELSNFDDDEFGDDESFRDVFDEDNPSSGNLGNENMRSTLPSLSASGSTDYSTKAPGLDESQSDLSFTDAIGPTNDGPPPPPPTTTTTKTVTSGKYQDEVAVGLSSLSPPPSVDGGGSSMGFSQTWHDTAVDGPHREKMLQDM